MRATRQLGLIAQEAQQICPSLVKTIHRTKKGALLTPEKVIPAVYETEVVTPAVYETQVVTPAVYEDQVVPAVYEDRPVAETCFK